MYLTAWHVVRLPFRSLDCRRGIAGPCWAAGFAAMQAPDSCSPVQCCERIREVLAAASADSMIVWSELPLFMMATQMASGSSTKRIRCANKPCHWVHPNNIRLFSEQPCGAFETLLGFYVFFLAYPGRSSMGPPPALPSFSGNGPRDSSARAPLGPNWVKGKHANCGKVFAWTPLN